MDKEKKLKELRRKIDVIDNKIVDLLKKRMALAVRTVKYKGQVKATKREISILRRVAKRYKPALSIFKTVMKESKKLQHRA